MSKFRKTYKNTDNTIKIAEKIIQLDKLPVEKVMNGKFVKMGGERVGFVCKFVWTWTRFGENRYPQDFRELAMAYAEDE